MSIRHLDELPLRTADSLAYMAQLLSYLYGEGHLSAYLLHLRRYRFLLGTRLVLLCCLSWPLASAQCAAMIAPLDLPGSPSCPLLVLAWLRHPANAIPGLREGLPCLFGLDMGLPKRTSSPVVVGLEAA